VYDVRLRVIDLGPGHAVRSIALWRADSNGWAELFVWADRLYAFGDGHLVVFDVADAGRPRQLSSGPFEIRGSRRGAFAGVDPLICDLIPLPGVPPAGRVAATLAPWGTDGQFLCLSAKEPADMLFGYRRSKLDDRTAEFKLVGQYRPTLLQRLVNRQGGFSVAPDGGLVYLVNYAGGDTFAGGFTVLDARGPRPMRPVGHFAAPGAWFVNPLPDGRAVVSGGNKLWLVGAPRRPGG